MAAYFSRFHFTNLIAELVYADFMKTMALVRSDPGPAFFLYKREPFLITVLDHILYVFRAGFESSNGWYMHKVLEQYVSIRPYVQALASSRMTHDVAYCF